MEKDYYSNIEDPIERRRALAESIGLLVDEILGKRGMTVGELSDKLEYIKNASDIIKRFD